jgi:hypothetical protein
VGSQVPSSGFFILGVSIEAERIETLCVRLKAEERAELKRTARRLGLTQSDLVRRSLSFSLPVFANSRLPDTKDERE